MQRYDVISLGLRDVTYTHSAAYFMKRFYSTFTNVFYIIVTFLHFHRFLNFYSNVFYIYDRYVVVFLSSIAESRRQKAYIFGSSLGPSVRCSHVNTYFA